jgi:hypothetical protein
VNLSAVPAAQCMQVCSAMKTSLISALVTMLMATGCAASVETKEEAPPANESDFTTVALTADAKKELRAWAGEWTAIEKVADEQNITESVRDAVRVTFEENAGSPGEGQSENKATVSLLKVDGTSAYTYLDRAPFARIGEKKDCESIRQEGINYIYICHQSGFDGKILRHRLTARNYQGNLIPTGPEEVAEQTLSLVPSGGPGETDILTYRYTINGKPSQTITLERSPTAAP